MNSTTPRSSFVLPLSTETLLLSWMLYELEKTLTKSQLVSSVARGRALSTQHTLFSTVDRLRLLHGLLNDSNFRLQERLSATRSQMLRTSSTVSLGSIQECEQ